MNKIKRLSRGVFLLSAFVALTASAETTGHGWTYEGEHGPTHWGAMGEAFHACERGRAESPIDIEKARKAPADMPRLNVNYQPLPIDIINTGPAVQFHATPGTNRTSLGSQAYQLVQFHFHSPGEERFAGKDSVMDAHLVHRSADG